MEKVIYVLWCDVQVVFDQWSCGVCVQFVDWLLLFGVYGVQVNVVDVDVVFVVGLKQINMQLGIDGIVVVWVDSVNVMFCQLFDDVVCVVVLYMVVYFVIELQLILNMCFFVWFGECMIGFLQFVFLKCLLCFMYEVWFDVWYGYYMCVVIDMQDNFLYVQNVVVCVFMYVVFGYDVIVEECFLVVVMIDLYVFFDVVGDEEKFQCNVVEMMDSCGCFIDFDKIDVVLMSQYVVKVVCG